jgi:hypothetical protein
LALLVRNVSRSSDLESSVGFGKVNGHLLVVVMLKLNPRMFLPLGPVETGDSDRHFDNMMI